MTLAKDNDMAEHLSPDRANQPFSISVLPWRLRCSWSVTNAHRAKPPDVFIAIGAIRDRERYSPVQPPSRKPPYLNFPGHDEGDSLVRNAFGAATYARLQTIKRKFDPRNLFRMNQNILPE